jgi:hypothetical protein
MERGIIKAADRNVPRSIKMAMQGDAIRALVELITNADDSYIRLSEVGKSSKNLIEILYEKYGYCGRFAVRDNAEGMSIEDVRVSFKKYGEDTSGLKVGKGVRGYFGQGAKDALAGMIDGKICTFKNDKFVECKLFIEGDKAWYEISNEVSATSHLRKKHGIEANGTVAYFVVDPKKMAKTNVPRLDTVHAELANNYLLRKIMTNEHRKIMLIDLSDKTNSRRIRYKVPEGKIILQEQYFIPYADYKDFPIDITILRSERELNQTGDSRDGGLLIIDDKNAVLSCSLYKYDYEPLAAHFFGEVQIERFRELLEREEPVLSEEREGLSVRHPFCKALIGEVEKRLENEIKKEKLRKQKEEQSKFDREEISRFKKAFNLLNDIAEREAEAAVNLAQEETDKLEEPPDGFCLYPRSAKITVGKRYVLELRLNTHIIPYGSIINISSTHPKIHSLCKEIKITPDDGVGIVQKYITIEGTEANIEGIIRVSTKDKISQTKIFVEPEKELLMSEGMSFQPESITLRPNQPRKVCLLIYIKMIEGGSIIKLTTDNDSISFTRREIEVNEADAVRHIAKYEFELWGEGAGQDGIVTASYESFCALLDIRIRSKEETEEKGRKGMFSEPEYSNDEDPLQRTSYSGETGKVTIYVNFPSVKHYLGDTSQYKKTLASQVFIADLVAERCFLEIAKKKMATSGVLIRPEARSDSIQKIAYEFSKKYGKKVHEVLVDQKLLKEQRNIT